MLFRSDLFKRRITVEFEAILIYFAQNIPQG